MMDTIFDWCVQALMFFADILGITYKEINVWVFVIIWPLLTLILIILIFIQQSKIRRLLQEKRQDGNIISNQA